MITKEYRTKAVWSPAVAVKVFSALSTDLETDVAIVGGGITGLSTACCLIKTGKRVVILESGKVGKGTTGASTGNLYVPIDERLYSIQPKHGEHTMRQVGLSRLAAINTIKQWIDEYGIDCQFQRVPWNLFTSPGQSKPDIVVNQEAEAAQKAGLMAQDNPPSGFPFKAGAIACLPDQAQFNPLSYVQQLAAAITGENCTIYENTRVVNVEDGDPCIVHTNAGKIKAKKVVMATHTPKGIYAVHTAMESYREYAVAVTLKEELPVPGIYWHLVSGTHYSVRPYQSPTGNYLLGLGEAHKVGNKKDNIENLKVLEEYLRRHFSVDRVEFKWAAQNYKPADNLPYIGVSPMEKNIYIATGFSADGLVYGTLSGMLIADDITGNENPWARLYDPKRFTPVASSKKFVKENIAVAKNLLKDYLFYGEARELKEIKPGQGKTIKVEGERVAAYRDENNRLHLVSSVCTHMGCIVHWNMAEKSWDCPCHGSRFTVDGDVIEGPAYDNLSTAGERKE